MTKPQKGTNELFADLRKIIRRLVFEHRIGTDEIEVQAIRFATEAYRDRRISVR